MEKKMRFVTMGEIMLRMTRPDYQRIIQGNKIDGFYGGSEANVAVSLAMMGNDVQYVTRLPDNMLGVACRNELRRYQVGTSHILWGGSRVGKYFYEQAASLRGSSIAYDRDQSSMMTLQPDMIDWKDILKDVDVFHWTGITCGLSEGASDTTLNGLKEAQQRGICISCDINYRKNLWKYGKEAHDVMLPALKASHIIFGDTGEWKLITGMTPPPFDAKDTSYELDIDAYRKYFEKTQELLPQGRSFIMGIRNVLSASHHLLTGVLYADGKLYHTGIVDINPVLDPIGVGDAYIAAYLHAHFRWHGEHQKHLNYALTAAAMKNTVLGDFNLLTEQEVLDTMKEVL
jgi:2-dehydro-3-deoxygluconokinase